MQAGRYTKPVTIDVTVEASTSHPLSHPAVRDHLVPVLGKLAATSCELESLAVG